jgi:3-oxoacyl-[acyl-carrier protein] reductase
MFDLTGKTALITGASGAIGGAIARVLQAQGAKVALHGPAFAPADALAAELGGHALVADLAKPEDVEKLAKDAEAALGGTIDILVNNAGITKDGLILRMKDEDWDAVLDINLGAAFRLSRAAARGMMKKRWGRIVNIASVVGVTGNPGQANYCASKAGLIGMTKALAQEMAARNVTANCVAPGFIATAMTEALNDEQKARILSGIPAGKMGTAADVAAAVLFLAGEGASYITGQTLHVNGGMAMV